MQHKIMCKYVTQTEVYVSNTANVTCTQHEVVIVM